VRVLKFGRFLNKVQKTIQYDVDIDLKTVRRIIGIFEDCLSMKQLVRWSTELDMIKSYKSTQTNLLKKY